MINHGMEYNSQRENLVIAEYGRHIQKLIQYTSQVEDDEKRNRLAKGIIQLMGQMNPAQRKDSDYLEKLWRHLFRISDYKINVVPPSGVVPSPELSEYIPSPIQYPESQKRNRHYGMLIKKMITKASTIEDKEKQHEFAVLIATYMKTAYRNWSQGNHVSDEMIKNDLKLLSDGKLELAEDVHIAVVHTSSQYPKNHHRKRSNNNKGKKNNRNKKHHKNRRNN